MSERTIEITNRAHTSAAVLPNSVNLSERTVELVFSTGAPVKRWSWDEGAYLEELDMAPAAVDLSRLNGGASFLDTHSQDGMAARLGAVVPGSARVEAGKGICTVKLSTARNGQQLLDDLAQGLPLPVSIGYRVHAYQKTDGDGDALPVYRATSWEPMEVSAVPVPADAGAHARADREPERDTIPVATHRRAESGAATLESLMTTAADPADTLERTRANVITGLAERYGAPIRLARKAIADGNSEGEFRQMLVEHQRKEQAKTEIFGIAPMDHQTNERSLSDRLTDAILARVRPGQKVEADVRQFVGLPMAEIARVALHARNESTHGVRQSELIGRALHTTSDFGLALSAVALRLVREGYATAPSQIRRIARETSARDFRAKTSIQFREGGTLEKVNEHGGFKRGTFVETGESYRIDTFGKVFGLTRQALVNDDLDLLATVPSRLGGFASAFESTFLAKLLESPAKMADGVNFFHANHGNLAASGTAISVASLGAARLALRRQKGIAGEVIAVEPKFLVVPPELETLAEQVLGDINAAKVEDSNPFAGRLELVVEPHLTNVQSWYLAAGAAETALEYAYLEGESGPQIETRQGFDIDGTEWKVRLDFGGGFVDHRGIFKNPGVTP